MRQRYRLRAWQTIPPQNPASLKAYLGRLCRCFAIDRYRHLRRRAASAAGTWSAC